jgi:hypothetical protein
MELRNKDIKIPFLDIKRSYDDRTFWQLLNVAAPLALVLGFGLLFLWMRKKKYAV